MFAVKSVENLKQLFEGRPKKVRSVSFDASVREHRYEDLSRPIPPQTSVQNTASNFKTNEKEEDSSYTYSDDSETDSENSGKLSHIPEKLV